MKLVIDGVSKLYKGNVWGLRDFSLTLEPGVLALVGPNGAGKSTLMRILATITKPTEGRVTWNDTDIVQSPDELRAVLGYLPQDFGIYPNLNAVEFLEYLAALKGLDGRAARKRRAYHAGDKKQGGLREKRSLQGQRQGWCGNIIKRSVVAELTPPYMAVSSR